MTSLAGCGPSLEEHFAAQARVAELMGVINAATAELVGEIETVLDEGLWNGEGIRSPEHWLMWRAGVSPGRARGLVRMARRRSELPEVMGRFAAGGLTEDAVRSIAHQTPASRDAELAELAPKLLHSQLSRVLRALPEVLDAGSAGEAPAAMRAPLDELHRSTRFAFRPDGWWELHALVPPDDGALVQRALASARDAEFADRKGDADQGLPVGWSDALVRLAATGLDALDPASARGEPRGPRAQVFVHFGVDATGEPAANLHLGAALAPSLRRYLCCDATVRAVLERDGELLGITPAAPTVDWRQRVLIEERDGGCRFPGCGQSRWVHVHHIRHREDGGQTVPTNLCCLCPFHHRLHHKGAFEIRGDPSTPDGLVFTTRHGTQIGPPTPTRPAQLPPQGAPPATFTPPLGERLDARWFQWN